MNFKVGFLALISAFIMSFGYVIKADFRPPGTVEIVENFFYDATEISNNDWREYLSFLKERNGVESDTYHNALPDTTVWLIEGVYNEPFAETYLSHPSYSDYPVVGVSQKQAMDYCTWRTGAVKTMLEANEFEGPLSFKYRLPSRTEWELIANGGFSAKQKKIIEKKKKEFKSKNIVGRVAIVNMKLKPLGKEQDTFDSTFRLPAPGRSFIPNKFGVYHIHGNVAEMVQEPGIAMGGSFEHFYDEIIPTNAPVQYEGPTNWLGFRCVCEVEQRK